MQVQVIVNCARSLKNVNWRYGTLNPYAVVWIDSSSKCSTKIDLNNNMNPMWNEKFTIPLPLTSFAETAILYIDIVHANAAPGTKPLVGTVRFPLCTVLNEARANGMVSRCLNLLRPSGRPQGTVEIMIGVKDLNVGHINQFNQQTPYNQQAATQPLHQAQMQPQAQFQPRPQIQPQGQFQSKPQMQPQAQFQPQLQGQFQPKPQMQPQAQFQPQPQPVIKSQGMYPSQQPVQPRPRPRPQPHPQLQSQVRPINEYPNKPSLVRPVVYAQNSQGLVRPTPVHGPRYSMTAATNRPAYRPAKPVPVQQQNNLAPGMGTRAEATRLNRDMLIPQNQNVQLANNANNNANRANDNGQIQCAPSADNDTDNSKEKYAEETYTTETYNDAESIQLAYEETACVSVGCDNGGYDYSENTTDENNNGGYDVNPGMGCYNEGYDTNAGVGCDNGGYDTNAGVGCDNGGYDTNAGVGCDNGGYDMNAGVGCDNGGYDMSAAVECDNGVYEIGDYVDEQCDGVFDGAGLDGQVNCTGEVEVSTNY